jgi:hypothetical protein
VLPLVVVVVEMVVSPVCESIVCGDLLPSGVVGLGVLSDEVSGSASNYLPLLTKSSPPPDTLPHWTPLTTPYPSVATFSHWWLWVVALSTWVIPHTSCSCVSGGKRLRGGTRVARLPPMACLKPRDGDGG